MEKFLPGIQKNILLKDYTTFRIGGRAKYFFIAKTKEDLILAIKMARKFNLPFFILGGGSNLLVSDKGFSGLIIKIQNSEFKIKNSEIDTEAGTILGKLAITSAKAGLSGLEWAVGIPGTVGGAIYGNAGAFGKSMADVVDSVKVLDVKKIKPLKIRWIKNEKCRFDYKDSLFKHKKNFIILAARFRLKKEEKSKIEKKIRDYLNYRIKTQPLNFPSAGSIFKNPSGFFVGQMIEKCGLKSKKIGNVKISEKHANFIINLGGGKAKDVKNLIKLIKKKIKNKFGLKLEEEIQYLGF